MVDRPSASSSWTQARRTRRALAWSTVVVSLTLLAIKLGAVALTGSRAILSDALESIVNVAAALIMLASITFAHQPADEEHPFGHGKIEALTAGLEGALLLAAAGSILWASIPDFFHPRELVRLTEGTVLVAATGVVNLVMGGVLIRQGRRAHSQALAADGRHLVADAATTGGLVVGIAVVAYTRVPWLDPALACALAVWVAYTGVSVLRTAVRSLLDVRSPEHVARVAELLRPLQSEGMNDPHDLRILDAGTELFVSLHVRVPRYWTIARATQLSARIKREVDKLSNRPVTVSVEIEPCIDANCPGCSDAACPVRTAPFVADEPIDLVRLRAPAEDEVLDAAKGVALRSSVE